MPCLASEPVFGVDLVEAWQCRPDYVADDRELEAAGVRRKPKRTWEACEAGFQ
eukprot:CAMPEP_0113722366 /NCGR_PEP_ID=MMETSP0038_2-20120614/37702_1 /TAXON_ID=2898 /ORGANISM="Cryptomonas paramecium" /LENGTH=52 /DNA_ID=CAMNT_0000651585 /DNA_START=453 /DNA_END=608 /DNA_ORIENTATION=+ /assembly_acc=CAM_ASM_000170